MHGYSGEVHINLHNVGKTAVTLNPGDKIIQAVMLPIVVPTTLEVTEDELYADINVSSSRGSGGFGSTGTK